MNEAFDFPTDDSPAVIWRDNTMLTHPHQILFDLLEPQPEMVQIKDIACALSNKCRHNGMLPYHVSVAEHCVHVFAWVSMHSQDINVLRWALLHDAEEAYYNDMISPLKKLKELDGYRTLVHRFVEQALKPRFELHGVEPPLVKRADRASLHAEQMVVRGIELDTGRLAPVVNSRQQPSAKVRRLESKASFPSHWGLGLQVEVAEVELRSGPRRFSFAAPTTVRGGLRGSDEYVWGSSGIFGWPAFVAERRFLAVAEALGVR